MSRTTPSTRVKFRAAQCADDWGVLVEIINEEAAKPGYSGPSPASVARVMAEIEATQVAAEHWYAAVVARPARRPPPRPVPADGPITVPEMMVDLPDDERSRQ